MIGDFERFERFMLRRGVGRLVASRHRCTQCGRTPLVGERVHSYEREPGIVCELCRSGHGGVPAATHLVRHSEFGHAVKLRAA